MRIQKPVPKKAVTPEFIFSALADRTRLRILCLLKSEELCVCDIVTALRAPQPTVSRHLKYLREAGLVRVRKEGLWMHYALASNAMPLQKKLLDCVSACVADIPEAPRDAERLAGSPRPGIAVEAK